MSNFPTIIINGGGLPGPRGPQGQAGSGTGDVIAINGMTGVINGVAFTGTANNYTELQTFSAGISAGKIAYRDVSNDFTSIQVFSTGISAGASAGITFNSDITVNQLKIGKGGGNISGNVAIGRFALNDNTSGNNNVAIGLSALRYGTTGGSNVAIGSSSLSNTQNSFNTSIGASSLQTNKSGTNNVAIGYNAGRNLESASNNVIIGANCVLGNTASTGAYNVAIGGNNSAVSFVGNKSVNIGSNITNSSIVGSNTLVGSDTGANTTTRETTCIGSQSNGANYIRSIFLGHKSGYLSTNTTVDEIYYDNIALGPYALQGFRDWDSPESLGTPINYINTAIIIGTYATVGFTSGSENEIVIGNGIPFEFFDGVTNYLQLKGAGPNTTTLGNTNTTKTIIHGNIHTNGISASGATFAKLITVDTIPIGRGKCGAPENIAIGLSALASNYYEFETYGFGNIAIGKESSEKVTTGIFNTSIGFGAAKNNVIGDYNVAIGANALNGNNGTSNVALGSSALYSVFGSTYSDCIGIGSNALYTNRSNFNIGIGTNSLSSHVSGTQNLGIGYGTLSGGNTSKNNNIALGQNSLNICGGNNNIGIGVNTLFTIANNSNSNCVIGNDSLIRLNGSNFIAIGACAGYYFNLAQQNIIGQDSIFIGNGSNPKSILDGSLVGATSINEIIIGTRAIGNGNNSTTLGNTATQSHHLNGTTGSILNVLGDRVILQNPKTISSRTQTGTAGTICWDQNYLYICVSTNAWAKVGLTW